MAATVRTVDNHSSEYSPLLLSEYDQHQNHDEDKEDDGFGDQNDDPCLDWQRPQSVKQRFGLGRRLAHLDLHLTTAL